MGRETEGKEADGGVYGWAVVGGERGGLADDV